MTVNEETVSTGTGRRATFYSIENRSQLAQVDAMVKSECFLTEREESFGPV